jgi:hypothetical protein
VCTQDVKYFSILLVIELKFIWLAKVATPYWENATVENWSMPTLYLIKHCPPAIHSNSVHFDDERIWLFAALKHPIHNHAFSILLRPCEICALRRVCVRAPVGFCAPVCAGILRAAATPVTDSSASGLSERERKKSQRHTPESSRGRRKGWTRQLPREKCAGWLKYLYKYMQ